MVPLVRMTSSRRSAHPACTCTMPLQRCSYEEVACLVAMFSCRGCCGCTGLNQRFLALYAVGKTSAAVLVPNVEPCRNPAHNRWHIALILASEPVGHIPEHFVAHLFEDPLLGCS